jgi:glycosyltransferase involved in cell wall biosynthesis
MKLSIVIPIYNSHEIVARQVKYFERMGLPDDIEFIFVDDGSNPPLDSNYNLANLKVYFTNDKRPWTQGLARNFGASKAKGKYLLLTDIDHILSYEAIMDAYKFTGDKMIFPRFFAVLLQDGTLTQDIDTLIQYGFDRNRLNTGRQLYASYHGNTYAIKKETFELLGGYDPNKCLYGHHAPSRGGEDGKFNSTWNKWAAKNNIQPAVGSKIYMFPIGRYHAEGNLNPMGLFHGLSQEQTPQPLKD